jgi:hypothetical protein
MVYAAKYLAMQAVVRIHELKSNITDTSAVLETVRLAYSLNQGRFKLSITDKLRALSLDISLSNSVVTPISGTNTVEPTLAFLLGFFLGDGYA